MSYWLKTDWLPTAAVLTEELRGIRVILVPSTANLKNIFTNLSLHYPTSSFASK
jgi:hypothetical protein